MTALAQPVATGTTAAATATSVSATLGSAPTPGNLLVAVVLGTTSAITAIGGPWGQTADVTCILAATARLSIFSKVAVPGESATVTASFGASQTFHKINLYEFSPNAGLAWLGLDQQAVNQDAGVAVSTLSSGTTPATTTPNGVAVAGFSLNGAAGSAIALTNGFTDTPNTNCTVGHKILTATGAQESTASWTTARRIASAIATYKQGVPASSAGFLALL